MGICRWTGLTREERIGKQCRSRKVEMHFVLQCATLSEEKGKLLNYNGHL